MRKISKSVGVLFLIILIFFAPAITEAKISISDSWDTSGKFSLESPDWTGVFIKEDGALRVYFKLEQTKLEGIKIVPFYSEKDKAESISSCKVVADGNEQIEIRIAFSTGKTEIAGDFLFNQNGTIQVKPFQNMKGISIFSPIEYGIIPGRAMTDNIYDPKDCSSNPLYLPSENIFMGLLKGEDRILVCAWPEGNQKLRLILKDSDSEKKFIQAVEVELDEKSIYLGVLAAPGIWHKEEPVSSYLGKDIEINWKRPFPAKWRTQLLEGGEFERIYLFKDKKGKTYRPKYGWYEWPVWFEEGKTFFHLSEKVPPCGEVFIYALEGHKNTPVEFVKSCLGIVPVIKEVERISDRPGDIVGGNWNWCAGRDLLNKVFKEARPGLQIREREFLKDVMADFRQTFLGIKERLEEYDNFILMMKEMINAWMEKEKDKPGLQSFFKDMKKYFEELKTGYEATKDGLTTQQIFQYDMDEVAGKLEQIFDDNSLEVLYPELHHILGEIKLWGAHHIGGVTFAEITTKWYQQAGYSCAENEATVSYAQKIRKCIREIKIGSWGYEAP